MKNIRWFPVSSKVIAFMSGQILMWYHSERAAEPLIADYLDRAGVRRP
jgi:hypothetical protein